MMTQRNIPASRSIVSALMVKRMLIGAGIALILITLFLSPFDYSRPEWGKYWMIRPLIVVPFAGACGGLCYHLLEHMRLQYQWKKAVVIVLSVIIYILGLWIGTVLGLNGTLWN